MHIYAGGQRSMLDQHLTVGFAVESGSIERPSLCFSQLCVGSRGLLSFLRGVCVLKKNACFRMLTFETRFLHQNLIELWPLASTFSVHWEHLLQKIGGTFLLTPQQCFIYRSVMGHSLLLFLLLCKLLANCNILIWNLLLCYAKLWSILRQILISCRLWARKSKRLVSRNSHETLRLLVFGVINLLSPSFNLDFLTPWIRSLKHISWYPSILKTQVFQHAWSDLLLESLLNGCIEPLLISPLFLNLVLFILSLPWLNFAHDLIMCGTPWPLFGLIFCTVASQGWWEFSHWASRCCSVRVVCGILFGQGQLLFQFLFAFLESLELFVFSFCNLIKIYACEHFVVFRVHLFWKSIQNHKVYALSGAYSTKHGGTLSELLSEIRIDDALFWRCLVCVWAVVHILLININY